MEASSLLADYFHGWTIWIPRLGLDVKAAPVQVMFKIKVL